MTNMRKRRIELGLSQKYIAIELGVSGPTVSEWENNKMSPTGKNLIRLAELLNCSTDYLLGRTDNPLFVHTYQQGDKSVTILDTTKEAPLSEEQEAIEKAFEDAPEATISPEMRAYIESLVGNAVAEALDKQNKD